MRGGPKAGRMHPALRSHMVTQLTEAAELLGGRQNSDRPLKMSRGTGVPPVNPWENAWARRPCHDFQQAVASTFALFPPR